MWSGLGRRGESQYNRQNHQVLGIALLSRNIHVPSTYPPFSCSVQQLEDFLIWQEHDETEDNFCQPEGEFGCFVHFINFVKLQTRPPVSCGTLTSPWTLRGTPAILATLHSGYGGPSTMKTASGVLSVYHLFIQTLSLSRFYFPSLVSSTLP